MYKLYESPSTHLSTKSNKVLSGLFAECEVFNQNERRYPKRIYMPALEELIPKIREGRLLGELDHPADRDEVCLSNVSHVIKDCKVEGNKVYGTVELLDTPAGKIAQALNEAGIPLGISSRGIGNTRRVDEGDEVTDFKLITFDLVADPSFSNAILTESAKTKLRSRLNSIASTLPLNESAGDGAIIRDRINDIKESLDKAPSVTETLVESVGTLTSENMELEDKLKESNIRNKSLKENMGNLQETYNALYESTKILESKYNELSEKHSKEIRALKESHNAKIVTLKESHNVKIRSLRESYDEKISGLNDEIIKMRKELCIERRGLSLDVMMPILEGLTTLSEIERKLDSVKHLNTRRYTVTSKDVEPLTEGASARGDRKLSTIISSV